MALPIFPAIIGGLVGSVAKDAGGAFGEKVADKAKDIVEDGICVLPRHPL